MVDVEKTKETASFGGMTFRSVVWKIKGFIPKLISPNDVELRVATLNTLSPHYAVKWETAEGIRADKTSNYQDRYVDLRRLIFGSVDTRFTNPSPHSVVDEEKNAASQLEDSTEGIGWKIPDGIYQDDTHIHPLFHVIFMQEIDPVNINILS